MNKQRSEGGVVAKFKKDDIIINDKGETYKVKKILHNTNGRPNHYSIYRLNTNIYYSRLYEQRDAERDFKLITNIYTKITSSTPTNIASPTSTANLVYKFKKGDVIQEQSTNYIGLIKELSTITLRTRVAAMYKVVWNHDPIYVQEYLASYAEQYWELSLPTGVSNPPNISTKSMIGIGNTTSIEDDNVAVQKSSSVCYHIWARYVGLQIVHDYCTKCGETKEISDGLV